MDSIQLNAEAVNSDSELLITTTASETSDRKNDLSREINKEIDKIFGPAIQRNRSGSDIEIVAPLKHKRRHYWSQERLFADKPQVNQGVNVSNYGLNSFHIDELRSTDEIKLSQIPVLHENQRAEIIASVTERLYSKLKKNEKVIPKVEPIFDKKPLNELKICSNARQRLMELSQKALKNKRRIGIPASTQTKNQITRVKNQAIEVQADLQSFVGCKNSYIHRKDVSIATEQITPRLKEIGVGPTYGILNRFDKDVATQTYITSYKNSSVTTEIIKKDDRSTQTLARPKMKNNSPHSNHCIYDMNLLRSQNDDSLTLIININISSICSLEPYSSEDLTDDEFSSEEEIKSNEYNNISSDNYKATTTSMKDNSSNSDDEKDSVNEFPQEEFSVLPHIMVDLSRTVDLKDYEHLILGRRKDMYPYNLKMSPYRKNDATRRAIKFKNTDINAVEGIERESYLQKHYVISDKNREDDCSMFPELTILKAPEVNSLFDKHFESDYEDLHKFSSLSEDMLEIENDEIEQDASDTIKNKRYRCKLQSKLENESDDRYYSLNSYMEQSDKHNGTDKNIVTVSQKRTPKEYLQYLLQIRRKAVASDNYLNIRETYHSDIPF